MWEAWGLTLRMCSLSWPACMIHRLQLAVLPRSEGARQWHGPLELPSKAAWAECLFQRQRSDKGWHRSFWFPYSDSHCSFRNGPHETVTYCHHMSWVRCNKFSSVNLWATLLSLSRPITKVLLPRNRLDKLLDCFRTDFRDRDGRRCLDFQHDIDAASFVAVRVRLLFWMLAYYRLPLCLVHCRNGWRHVCLMSYLNSKSRLPVYSFLRILYIHVHIMSLYVSIAHSTDE